MFINKKGIIVNLILTIFCIVGIILTEIFCAKSWVNSLSYGLIGGSLLALIICFVNYDSEKKELIHKLGESLHTVKFLLSNKRIHVEKSKVQLEYLTIIDILDEIKNKFDIIFDDIDFITNSFLFKTRTCKNLLEVHKSIGKGIYEDIENLYSCLLNCEKFYKEYSAIKYFLLKILRYNDYLDIFEMKIMKEKKSTKSLSEILIRNSEFNSKFQNVLIESYKERNEKLKMENDNAKAENEDNK